jgi:hypothetical protein
MLRDIEEWFVRRIPAGWFAARAVVSADNDEILVMGALGEPDLPADATPAARQAAALAAIKRFREETRDRRIAIANEAEQRFGRHVAWGATCNDARMVFTTVSVPVMTRLRMPERQVLDTLIEAGVARTRSDALAWCVRLVGEHEADWVARLREALVHVQEVRASGPGARRQ